MAQSEEFGSVGGVRSSARSFAFPILRKIEGDQAASEPKTTISVGADAGSGVQEQGRKGIGSTDASSQEIRDVS